MAMIDLNWSRGSSGLVLGKHLSREFWGSTCRVVVALTLARLPRALQWVELLCHSVCQVMNSGSSGVVLSSLVQGDTVSSNHTV